MHTVLLVDDDSNLLDLYSRVLEDMGCVVATATDGHAALRMAPALRPQLVITDMTMPRMGGLELCQRLQEDARLRDIPIILHSGLDRVGRTPPGVAFLSKTGDLSRFREQVLRSLATAEAAPLTSAA